MPQHRAGLLCTRIRPSIPSPALASQRRMTGSACVAQARLGHSITRSRGRARQHAAVVTASAVTDWRSFRAKLAGGLGAGAIAGGCMTLHFRDPTILQPSPNAGSHEDWAARQPVENLQLLRLQVWPPPPPSPPTDSRPVVSHRGVRSRSGGREMLIWLRRSPNRQIIAHQLF